MELSEAILGLIKKAAIELRPDVLQSLEVARKSDSPLARQILDDIVMNCRIAKGKKAPICQDTGALNFFVKKGEYSEGEIVTVINDSVAKATKEGILRPNSVDSVSGKNLGNIPEVHIKPGEFEIKLLLKGGGSENVSAQYSLPDSALKAGRDLDGVKKCILDAVFRAQGNGCSPYFVGICVGGQRESGYLEAKKQLFRKNNERSKELAELECSVKDKINKLGIGPMGLGGKATALDVFATSLPRHPASYFVSVSLNCWALRRWTLRIKDGKADYS